MNPVASTSTAILRSLLVPAALITSTLVHSGTITVGQQSGQLDIRQAGTTGVRMTLMPAELGGEIPQTPTLIEPNLPDPVISLREIERSDWKRLVI